MHSIQSYYIKHTKNFEIPEYQEINNLIKMDMGNGLSFPMGDTLLA